MKKKEIISLLIAVIVFGTVIILSLWYLSKPKAQYIQGQAEATEINVASKVPGRVKEIYVKEGDSVKEGQLLLELGSPEIDAKLEQANAAKTAAVAQSNKAKAGARKEQIQAAYNQWQQAKVAAELAEKTYQRINNLYNDKVVPAQKRDEAYTQMIAMQEQAKAANSQYEMAKKGTRIEDKEAASALVSQANAVISEVEVYKREANVYAPSKGEIQDIIPNKGEIVNAGYPIVNLVDLNDIWVVFNIREDKMNQFRKGNTFKAMVPALDNEEIELTVKYIAVEGDYATWNATTATGDFDKKTFKIKAYPNKKIEGLRPGMSVLINDVNTK